MLILFSSFSFFSLWEVGRVGLLTDKQKLENVTFFFRFFFAGVEFTINKPTVFRVSPGKLRIAIWWVVGSVRTRARFNLSLILILYIIQPSRIQGTTSVQVQRLARVPGVVTVCSYPTEITL